MGEPNNNDVIAKGDQLGFGDSGDQFQKKNNDERGMWLNDPTRQRITLVNTSNEIKQKKP
jgi:hypothetical protein